MMPRIRAMRAADSDDEDVRSRPSVRELEVLHAVITTRKTTAAAQRLGISQPAVSRAIASLESRLGRDLFVRDGGRLVPTADAFALDAEAAPIFAALSRLEGWPNTQQTGTLIRIVAPATLAQTFLSVMIARFMATHPDVRIQLEIGRSADVVSAVADGSADLGMVDTSIGHAGVRAEVFRRAIAHALVPSDHRLASMERVTPTDLHEEPILALTRRFSVRAQIEKAFAEYGHEMRVVVESAASSVIAQLVRARLGIALLNPFPLSLADDPSLAFVPFEPAIGFDTAFLLPATGSALPAARRFVDFVRNDQPDDRYTVAIR
jgi:DNA-binding transcriptional LysR family regulator